MIASNSNVLPLSDLEKLRSGGLIRIDETVIKEGDVLVAVDLVTGARRIIESKGLVLECNRRILKD